MQQYFTTLIGVMGFIAMVTGIIGFINSIDSLRKRLRSTLIIVFGAILISPLLIINLPSFIAQIKFPQTTNFNVGSIAPATKTPASKPQITPTSNIPIGTTIEVYKQSSWVDTVVWSPDGKY